MTISDASVWVTCDVCPDCITTEVAVRLTADMTSADWRAEARRQLHQRGWRLDTDGTVICAECMEAAMAGPEDCVEAAAATEDRT